MTRLSLSTDYDSDDSEHDIGHDTMGLYDSCSEDEEEPPHPLGFVSTSRYSLNGPVSSSWGKSRFSLDPQPIESLDQYKRRWGYADNVDDDYNTLEYDMFESLESKGVQSYPPLSSYVDSKTVPTVSLMKFSVYSRDPSRFRDEDAMDQVTELLSRVRVNTMQSPILTRSPQQRQLVIKVSSPLPEIQRELQEEKKRMELENMEAAKALRQLLKKNEDKANNLLLLEEKRKQEVEAKKKLQEREAEEKAKAKAEEEQRMKRSQKSTPQGPKVQPDEIKSMKPTTAPSQQAVEQKIDDGSQKKDYVAKGKKLIAQLVQLRASIEPFDKSKEVSKRRLQMKKIVRGRVNTLSESVEKVKAVAADVGTAISDARQEDERIKREIQAGNRLPPEMARGKRYFIDLLASSVIVRAQADGFNGLRGDGFPLANMLAILSVDNKELVPVLQAHVYTVCPTAMPTLPNPSKDVSEDVLMESLGMSKDKKGEFETFERFLTRTESIISLVADIMSSNPPTHVLFGGHKAAVEWLQRFLDLLPPAPQSPLPLLTATVLDAFLTGAGHMLATKHPKEFKSHLDVIIDDVIKRLDEGSIGQPSATRLKKTVKNGFEGFKNNLPPRALAELYYGATAPDPIEASKPKPKIKTGKGAYAIPDNNPDATQASTSDVNRTKSGGSSKNDPFGGGQKNPFGSGGGGNGKNPFGGNSSIESPFGAPSSQKQGGQAPNPFGGGGGNAFSSSSNPFGGGSQQGNSLSGNNPFGGNSMQDDSDMASTPFGGGASASSNNPFGSSSSSASPFGGGGSNFGGGNTNNANQVSNSNSSMFGSSSGQSNPTSFGQSSGFSPSPFSQSTNTPFGNSATSQSPFGQAKPSATPFGFNTPASAQQTPFGQSSQGFGSSTTFGKTQSASPFGQNAGSGKSAFGGGSNMNSTFGGSSNTQRTPFGGGNNNKSQSNSFGGNRGGNRPPCKFFAEGRCRFGANCRFSHDAPTSAGGW